MHNGSGSNRCCRCRAGGLTVRSAAAGSTPNRQRSFVFEQDGVSLGFVAWLFWAVENVYDYFRRWSLQGVWSQVLDQLTQRERRRNGRATRPSAGFSR